MGPLILFIISIFIGFFPLMVSGYAGYKAKKHGCSVSAAGVTNNGSLSKEEANKLYSMFMFGMLGMFTMGFAFLGTIIAIIWAVLKMF